MWRISLLLTLTGCVEWIASDPVGEPAGLGELMVVAEVTGRYQDVMPFRGECGEYVSRMRVLLADRDSMLHWCWRDEPGRCAAGESRSEYGCAAGCFIQRGGDPTAVISERLDTATYLAVLAHETVHALGHCHKNYLATGHTEPFYYIAERP